MRKQLLSRVAVVGAVALSIGGIVAASGQGQGQGGPPPGPGGYQQGQFGRGGGPPFGGGRFGGPGGMFGRMPGALTATSSNVYVLDGNMLYSYDAHTLKLIAETQLPAPTPPAGQAAPPAPGQ